jgi:hypothetical protein
MKNKILKGIIVILLLSLLYYGYTLIQNNTFKYTNLENSVDSLNSEITKLDSIHVKQDSIIVLYKDSIVYLDNVIEKEKIKYIQIKQKYDEARTRVNHYNPTQLDSFFKQRYRHIEAVTPSR